MGRHGGGAGREAPAAGGRARPRPDHDVGRAVRHQDARRDGRRGRQDRVAAGVGQHPHADAAARARRRPVELGALLRRVQPREEVAHAGPRDGQPAGTCSCASSPTATSSSRTTGPT